MIKKSVINYLKCLKYVFTPLGIITLGLVCGLSIAIPNIINAVSDMCKNIITVLNDALADNAGDFQTLYNSIAASVRALDWSDPMQALSVIFTKQWFNDTVLDDINKILGGMENHIAEIKTLISACIDKIIAYAIVVAIFTVIAFIASYFLTRRMIRGDIAKRSFKNFIIGSIVGAVLWPACISLGIWLAVVWKNSIYITAVVIFILACIVSLLNAYLIHGRKKVALKSVVNIKNIIKLILSDLIIFAIGIAITLLIVLLTNIIVGIFVFVGIVMVTIPVMEMTSESYVKELVSKSESPIDPLQQTNEQAATEQPEAIAQDNNNN
ncbi:MAG: hypothetical protein J1G04_02505 [Clostridiales bacterium]|nr:hypothetical protein [Clostridiales bacterium]